MKLTNVLLLGQPQCPKCYAILGNRLNMDVTNYLNNTAVFVHPESELCKDSGLETSSFLLKDYIVEIARERTHVSDLKIIEREVNAIRAENGTVTQFPVTGEVVTLSEDPEAVKMFGADDSVGKDTHTL